MIGGDAFQALKSHWTTCYWYCIYSTAQVTWPAQYYVEVHAVDANVRVIFDTQINVFLDAKAKISCRTEVTFSQLILPDLS